MAIGREHRLRPRAEAQECLGQPLPRQWEAQLSGAFMPFVGESGSDLGNIPEREASHSPPSGSIPVFLGCT